MLQFLICPELCVVIFFSVRPFCCILFLQLVNCVGFVQDQNSSSVTTEEICVASESEKSNPIEDSSSHVTRSCKSVKAGEKAPEEVIKLWKENGFSR